ncbi:hypothetical protein [Xanthomonas campestris]|uniref:hypothetical protein n=1 Tax=Xanthomonas campestris TaxID=339 RepID=UPI001F24CAA7|nr:hypothetical protein [Xanthomonas campestris]MCF8796255.1 hypothetical protein [Xanthomonas campestris pv. campestris]MCF8814722.1 hypothetical protein [Xanthomonas campestris pv. campestris]WHO86720.1 hypothetical protein QMY63_11090 [Xanthomonas campestris]
MLPLQCAKACDVCGCSGAHHRVITRVRRLVIYARALPVRARDAPGSSRWWMPRNSGTTMHKTVLDVFVVGIVIGIVWKHHARATTVPYGPN